MRPFIVQAPGFTRLLDFGVWLLSGLGYKQNTLPSGFGNKESEILGCVHSPHNRTCWRDGFDINTDYEVEIPPGKLVEYDLVVSEQAISPDGYLANCTTVNGQFPGPTIEAEWGDTIRITVHNNLTNHNGTSIHWHGLRQFQTNWLDGVPGVTQCPSKPGDAQVYEFRAMQYGTAWYHSHWSLQYTNGVLGPIHIKGPSSANYDVDLGPLIISDWYHHDAFGLYHVEIDSPHAPMPVTTILNGKGVFDCNPDADVRCTGQQERHEIVFEKGKRYKIGLINTGSLLTYKFWIDGHKFTVTQNDLVPIKPFETDVLIIGIAQRYEFIIEAKADFDHGSNFWIRGLYCDEEEFPTFLDSRIGIIRYDEDDRSDPHDLPESEQHPHYGCQDPAPKDLVPIVQRQVGQRVNGMSPADYLKIGLQSWPNISDPNSRIHKWALANRTQLVDWRDPTLKRLTLDGDPGFDPRSEPIYLDYETGDWVYFVIENNYTMESVEFLKTIPRSVHPIHLHGHDFVILAQGKGEFNKDIVPQLDNPARRDVVNCPIGGYVWIAFQVNNPGAWLMHCHIAWHASAGLSLQFIEQRDKIKGLMEVAGALPELDSRCEDWIEHYSTVNIPKGVLQDDSGI